MNLACESQLPSARQSLWSEYIVIALAIASFVVLGGVGAGLARYFATPPLVFGDNLSILYWTRWGAAITGRWTGDLICGFLLGRFLLRISPYRVLLALSLFPAVVLVINGFFLNVDSGRYREQVGLWGVVFQLIAQVVAMLGVVAVGIWIGRQAVANQ